jgi:hypothetical protein
VVELSPNNLFYPRVVASPLNEPVKSDEEVELKEVGNNGFSGIFDLVSKNDKIVAKHK